ncbi:MAG: cytochrome C oxidase subunit IV family protein [Planctomycetota bacterium]
MSDQHHHDDHDHVHVTPFWPMFVVFVLLIILTLLTVWSSNLHVIIIGNTTLKISGNAHILSALVIAVVKGLMVAAYFMHLRYDKPLNTVVAGSTVFAVLLFIGLTLFDVASRDTVLRKEGGGASVVHPQGNLNGVPTDGAGSIHPGGLLTIYSGDSQKDFKKGANAVSIMEIVREDAIASMGNPDAHHDEEHHDDESSHADPAGETHTEGDDHGDGH